MKKYIFIIFMICSASVFASSPDWVVNLEKKFPTDRYIRAIGEGASVEKAKESALGELSSYFYQRVSNHSFASKINSLNDSVYSDSFIFKQSITALSDSKLYFVQFTNGYYDNHFKKWIVCAYIEREQSWKILSKKMNSIITVYNSLIKDAECEEEKLLKILLYKNAEKQLSDFNTFYKYALVILPDECSIYNSFIKNSIDNLERLNQLKKEITFSISVIGDFQNEIQNHIASIISEKGLIVIQQNGMYKIDAVIILNQTKTNNIYFASPQIQITVKNDFKTITSFYKNVEKIAVYNFDVLENMIIANIQETLDLSFRELFNGD